MPVIAAVAGAPVRCEGGLIYVDIFGGPQQQQRIGRRQPFERRVGSAPGNDENAYPNAPARRSPSHTAERPAPAPAAVLFLTQHIAQSGGDGGSGLPDRGSAIAAYAAAFHGGARPAQDPRMTILTPPLSSGRAVDLSV